jgi:hypothetical protein
MKAIKSLFGGNSKSKKSPRSSNNSPDVEENSTEDGMASNGSGPPSHPRSASNMASAQLAKTSNREEYVADISPEEMDQRLEACINAAMDFLANEGLETPNLFRSVPVQRTVDQTMYRVRSGDQIDFITLNDAPLTIAVLLECIKGMSLPVFPTHLLESLSEAQRLSRQDPIDKRLHRLVAFWRECVKPGSRSYRM